MPVFRTLLDKNKTQHFEQIAIIFCDVFNIVDPVVCSLAVKQYEVCSVRQSILSILSAILSLFKRWLF